MSILILPILASKITNIYKCYDEKTNKEIFKDILLYLQYVNTTLDKKIDELSDKLDSSTNSDESDIADVSDNIVIELLHKRLDKIFDTLYKKKGIEVSPKFYT
jgi:hypothetical protein